MLLVLPQKLKADEQGPTAAGVLVAHWQVETRLKDKSRRLLSEERLMKAEAILIWDC